MLTSHPLLVAAGFLSIVLTLIPARTLAAGVPPIAPSFYPPHTRITTIDPLSNQHMDCDWGFACHGDQPVTSAPVFHLRTQDDLHRVSGWAQFGDRRGHTTRMLFAVYASRYTAQSAEGMPWNVMAFADFRGALMAEGYEDLNHVPRLLPKGAVGNTSAQLARSVDGDVFAMTYWTGSIEAEGVVVYAHGSPAQHRLAVRDLTLQMRATVNGL